MNSPLEKFVREVIKMPLGLEFAHVCEYEHCPFFHCGSARRASVKQNASSGQLGGWICCCSIVQHKYYLLLLLQQGRFQSRATNTWQEIFPRGQFTFPWQVTM